MLEREKSIIMVSTTISICIMLLLGTGKSQEKKEISNIENTKVQNQIIIDKSKSLKTPIMSLGNLEEDKSINASKNTEKDTTVKETEKPIEEKNTVQSAKATENNNKDESKVLPIQEENLKKEEETENTAAVFKINREDIFGELSFADKEKLFLISTKLKASDYKKISNLLEVDVDGQGVLTSLKILKERLSKNDYAKIKQIFSKFINMDLVDN